MISLSLSLSLSFSLWCYYHSAGVLQAGDRILSINGVHVDGVATAHQALKLVQEGGDQLEMEVEFDVAGESCDLAMYVCSIMWPHMMLLFGHVSL